MLSKQLVILRGLTGSGKSVWAKKQSGAYVCSSDSFFENGYDPAKEVESHAHIRTKAVLGFQIREPLIIIDDFNIQVPEVEFYAKLSSLYGYDLTIYRFLQSPGMAVEKSRRSFTLEKCRDAWLELRKQPLMLCENELDVFKDAQIEK